METPVLGLYTGGILYWGYIGIMEKKMATTGLGDSSGDNGDLGLWGSSGFGV